MKQILSFSIMTVFLLGCSSGSVKSGSARVPSQDSSAQPSSPIVRHYQDSLSCKLIENPVDYDHEYPSALSGFAVGPNAPKVISTAIDLKQPILRPFSSDGCSSSPDGIPMTKNSSVWVDCCVRHDTAYWMGGTKEQKKQADEQLKSCISDKGYPNVAKVYKSFVNEFGGPDSTQSFRWGYGWNYKRKYSALTEEENNQIKNLYGVGQDQLPDFIMAQPFALQRVCDTTDTVFLGLRKEEIEIYNFLNSHLKKADVMTWARLKFFNQVQMSYEIKLQSCVEPVVVTLYQDKSRSPEMKSSCE